jgi:DNA polymerase (family X)
VRIGNEQIAQALDEVGELLAAQDATPFRAAAYRRAAEVVRTRREPIAALREAGGLDALVELPGIGPSLARAIGELADTGRLGLLERLRGQADPESRLATVPGIGPTLAARLHDDLGIETLEELETAAHDGRLARLPGFGTRRVRAVIDTLAGRLGMRWRRSPPTSETLPVTELLDVDREYRARAAAGDLRCIAPRRFNPERAAWLSVLHTERGTRHYTALFSNTARAHELGRTHDWVVIYRDDGAVERQATVVTETHGPLVGLRVVRGREHDCAEYYRHAGILPPAAPRRGRARRSHAVTRGDDARTLRARSTLPPAP